MTIDVTLLGTGSPIPDPNRAGPATLVQAAGSNVLVDAGRGVVLRLAGAGVLPNALTAVVLTHLHSDHICALNDVVTTHWVMSPAVQPLAIHGPPGTARMVAAMTAMLEADVGYRIAHHDDLNDPPEVLVTEHGPGETFTLGALSVSTFETVHRPVEPTLGFRFEHGGAVAAIAGDTIPCPGLDALCRDADVYVQTVIRDDLVRLVPNARLQDILDYHSSVEQAARTATAAGVGTLVMTHFVPPVAPGQEDEWRAIAARHFSGPIVVGDDLTRVRAEPR